MLENITAKLLMQAGCFDDSCRCTHVVGYVKCGTPCSVFVLRLVHWKVYQITEYLGSYVFGSLKVPDNHAARDHRT
jgi:hypothetical protein